MDVAAVLAALCALPEFRAPLEHGAGRPLDEGDLARLTVLAGLHDIGKAHPGFQLKALRASVLPHSSAGYGLVAWRTGPLASDLAPLLGSASRCLFHAVFAHHGRPVSISGYDSRSAWEVARLPGYDWVMEARDVISVLRNAFPSAFEPGPPLPTSPPFVHQFAGLLVLADWIASDSGFFPFIERMPPTYGAQANAQAAKALRAIGLDRRARRVAGNGFDAVSPYAPRPAQEVVGGLGLAEQLVILEAETGSGKTEAALWHFARLHAAGQVGGLYFAVPTRAAARQLHRRVNAAVQLMFGSDAPEAVLAIPGQRVAGDATGYALPDFATRWDDSAEGARIPARWAAEQATRFLAATIAVGTVDQVMLAALAVKHAPARGAALARSLLVIDEVHASDSYMNVVIAGLIRDHMALGGHVLLMSATLGSIARVQFQGASLPDLTSARQLAYPVVWSGRTAHSVPPGDAGKQVAMETRPGMGGDLVAAEAITAARKGARVLIVRNTVAAAIETFRAVQAANAADLLMQAGGGPALHHSRFAPEDRALLDAAVEATLGPRDALRGAIVIGTQTLEQSLDLCADLLITDLCPVDVLLQRLGRLHRRPNPRPEGFHEPRTIVLLPDGGLDPLAEPRFVNGLGAFRAKDGTVSGIYMDLPGLALTTERIAADPVWRIPAMNRDLVEGCTHAEARAGMVAARGWESYERDISGQDAAQRMMAGRLRLDRSKPLPEAFPDLDEAVMTRLGEMGPEVMLPPDTIGPFGAAISRLVLPARWAKRVEIPEVVRPVAGAGGIELRVDRLRLRYGREGLVKIVEA